MEENRFFLVHEKVLPPVIKGVVLAKELLSGGKAASASGAVKAAGISRSAFYKYKDFVFKYSEQSAETVHLTALLSDKAGVFSALTTVLYESGANILTVNQNVPVDGTASVALTIETGGLTEPLDRLLQKMLRTDGVISINKTVRNG